MRISTLLLAGLLLCSLQIHADPVTEEEVRQRIDAARKEVDEARSALGVAKADLERRKSELINARRGWNALQDNIRFLEERLESANNSLAASVGHQDRELKRYQDKLQRQLRQNASPEEIEETRRYIRAYENWRATRLRKNGLNDWIRAIRNQLNQKKTEEASMLQSLQASIQNTKAAETAIEEKHKALQAAEEKLATTLLEAPQLLAYVSPPYLKKVMVVKGGKAYYAAEWDDYVKLIDKQIEVIQKGIEEQKSMLAAQKELIDVTIEDLTAQNRLAQEKMDAYVSEVQGWGVTRTILADVLDAGINIARNFKQMGPYAFAFEAVYRVGELGLWATGVTGPANEDWDITKLPSGPNTPVDATTVAGTYVSANVKDQIKGQILNLVKSYIGTSDFGIPGSDISFTNSPDRNLPGNFTSLKGLKDKWTGLRQLVNEGKFWVLADEALKEKWLAPLTDPNAGPQGLFATLKRNPRQFLQNLKSSFNKDMMKGALLDLVQTSFIQYLKNWATETRLRKWSDYLVEDIKRQELTQILKAAGKKRDFQQQTLEALNEVLLELIRDREKQAALGTRFFKPLEDDVLTGAGIFSLILEFSAPVQVDSVILGTRRIDGAVKETTWKGNFDLTGFGEDSLAQLLVSATGVTTQKRLDDPRTTAIFQSTTQSWTGYEEISDRYHRVKLKSLRRGTSILFLVDCSGSMGDNNRMQKAIEATTSVLNSKMFDPADEVALMAFYECGDVELIQPFTYDPQEIKGKLSKLVPAGGTPLCAAMIAGSHYLESTSRNIYRKMILLTDGQETCNGNEFDVIQRIKKFHQEIQKEIL